MHKPRIFLFLTFSELAEKPKISSKKLSKKFGGNKYLLYLCTR